MKPNKTAESLAFIFAFVIVIVQSREFRKILREHAGEIWKKGIADHHEAVRQKVRRKLIEGGPVRLADRWRGGRR